MNKIDWKVLVQIKNDDYDIFDPLRDSESCFCPICEMKLIVDDRFPAIKCKNECFSVLVYQNFKNSSHNYNAVSIYKDKFSYHHSVDNSTLIYIIEEKIKYWRENYRYITELLERS